MKEELLALLLKKGFKYTFYKEQGLYFYSLMISEPAQVIAMANKFYEYPFEDDFNFEGVSFLVEMQDNFETAQWIFLNGLEKYEIYDNLEDFMDFVKELPDQVEVTF